MFTFMGRKKRAAVLSYVKIFVSFVIIVLGANTALSSAMYVNYERHSVNLVQTYTVEELSQISYSTNFMFEAAKLTLLQLYANPAVLKLMNYSDLDELEAASLLRQVGVVHINLPLVNSVYIYNKTAQKMYFDGKAFPLRTFPDQDIVSRLNENGQVRNLRPMARSILSPSNYSNLIIDPAAKDDVYTFVFYDSSSDQIDNAIVLNVSQAWMKHTVESMSPQTSGETVIADSSGLITLGNERYGYMDNINRYLDLSDILQRSNESGYVVKTIDGEKYLVSYVASPILDWKYIRFTPYDAVSGKLKQLLLMTIVIFILVTVLSVLAVVYISRAVYGLFSSKIKELEKKYDNGKHAGYEKKQQYLRMLATRKMEESFLQPRFARHGIAFDLNGSFMAVVFKIDGYDRYCSTYSLEDRALLSFGMINIAGELTGSLFTHEAVDLGDGFLAILFNLDAKDDLEITVKLEGLIKDIQDKTTKFLGLSLSAAVGDLLDEIGEMPGSIAQCKEALDYKLFYGPKSMLYASRIKELKKQEYAFPDKTMAELFEHLLAGNKDGIYGCCRSMIESMRGYSMTSLQTTILQLAISLKEFLKKYHIFADEINYDQFIDMANRIASYETLDEVVARLQQLFDGIGGVLSQSQETFRRHERYSGILENVQSFLEKEFANPNLSPEMIADHLGISAKYLRTLYKKASGESMGETINRYRMDRAKDFLEHSEHSVQEVAVRSGFANINYFYTLFKKYNGITPNEFRGLKLSEPK